jgi:tetratricopeptide (TPR) repeat protein
MVLLQPLFNELRDFMLVFDQQDPHAKGPWLKNNGSGLKLVNMSWRRQSWAGWLALVMLLALGPRSGWAATVPSGNSTLQRAADLVEWGRLKEARDLLASAVAAPANGPASAIDARLMAYYAHVLIKFGDLSSGQKWAKRAVALDDNCATCHLYLFEAMAERAKGMSTMRGMWELPKVKKQLELATTLGPDLGDVQWGWVDFELGLPKVAGGSIEEARAHAERLERLDAVDGHLALAAIAQAAGDSQQELAEYRAAAHAAPTDPRGAFALGKALFERGDYAAAAPHLSRALALNAQSALYSGYQAANLVHLHQLEQARAVLAAGKSAQPDSRLGEYLTAKALKATGQDFGWARQLLASYLNVPAEPDQPTAAQGRELLAGLG